MASGCNVSLVTTKQCNAACQACAFSQLVMAALQVKMFGVTSMRRRRGVARHPKGWSGHLVVDPNMVSRESSKGYKS